MRLIINNLKRSVIGYNANIFKDKLEEIENDYKRYIEFYYDKYREIIRINNLFENQLILRNKENIMGSYESILEEASMVSEEYFSSIRAFNKTELYNLNFKRTTVAIPNRIFGLKKSHANRYARGIVKAYIDEVDQVKVTIDKALKDRDRLIHKISELMQYEIKEFMIQNEEELLEEQIEQTRDLDKQLEDMKQYAIKLDLNEAEFIQNEFNVKLNEEVVVQGLTETLKDNMSAFLDSDDLFEDVSLLESDELTCEKPSLLTSESMEIKEDEQRTELKMVDFWDSIISTEILKQSDTGKEEKIVNIPFTEGCSEVQVEEFVQQPEAEINFVELQETNDSSEKMSIRLENEKNRYMIDKIVGADIFNSDNILLAKKGMKITCEIINKVQDEGKIVDLILNMILPED